MFTALSIRLLLLSKLTDPNTNNNWNCRIISKFYSGFKRGIMNPSDLPPGSEERKEGMDDPKAVKTRDSLLEKFAKSDVIDNFTPFLRVAEANVDLLNYKEKNILKQCQQIYSTVVREQSVMCAVPPIPQKRRDAEGGGMEDRSSKHKLKRKLRKYNNKKPLQVQYEADLRVRAQFKEWTLKAESWLKNLKTLKLLHKDVTLLTTKIDSRVVPSVKLTVPPPDSIPFKTCPVKVEEPPAQLFNTVSPAGRKVFHCNSNNNNNVPEISSPIPNIPQEKRIKLEAKRKLGDRRQLLERSQLEESTPKPPLKTPIILVNTKRTGNSSTPSNTNDPIPPTPSTKVSFPTKQTTFSGCNSSVDNIRDNSRVPLHSNTLGLLQRGRFENVVTIRSQKSPAVAIQFKIKVEDEGRQIDGESKDKCKSQRGLNHWDMVTEACAGVLKKMDLDEREDEENKGYSRSSGGSNKFNYFKDGSCGCCCSIAKVHWGSSESLDGRDDLWVTVVDKSVQCLMSDEENFLDD